MNIRDEIKHGSTPEGFLCLPGKTESEEIAESTGAPPPRLISVLRKNPKEKESGV